MLFNSEAGHPARLLHIILVAVALLDDREEQATARDNPERKR
jgi:hypothetical protein